MILPAEMDVPAEVLESIEALMTRAQGEGRPGLLAWALVASIFFPLATEDHDHLAAEIAGLPCDQAHVARRIVRDGMTIVSTWLASVGIDLDALIDASKVAGFESTKLPALPA